jgi:hypothetical protein
MKIKKITVSLDKLDQEQLKALKNKTGKSEAEIIKLALNELHGKIVENKKEVVQLPPVYVYVYTSYPSYYPYYPTYPLYPYCNTKTNETWPTWIIDGINGTAGMKGVSSNQITYNDGHSIDVADFNGGGSYGVTVGTVSDGTYKVISSTQLKDSNAVQQFVSSIYSELNTNNTNES